MRAVVDAKEFSKALDKVSKAVRKSKFVPILEEVLVRFANGRCVLMGTDLETWLTTEIPAQGDDLAFVFRRTASVVKACRHFDGELAIELTETGEGRKRQLRLCMSCGDRVFFSGQCFPPDGTDRSNQIRHTEALRRYERMQHQHPIQRQQDILPRWPACCLEYR